MQITIYFQYIDTWKTVEHCQMQKRSRRTKMEKKAYYIIGLIENACLVIRTSANNYEWEMARERGGMGVRRIQFWQSTLEDIFGSEEDSWRDVQLHSSCFQE